MNDRYPEFIDILGLFAGIISIIIPLIFFFVSSPEKITPQTLIIFGIIVLVLLIGPGWYYLYGKWKKMNDNIRYSMKSIDYMKRSLNFKELFDDMDVRLRVIESLYNKNKKGQSIDPRIIWLILLLILLYLFLKSVGVF